MSKRSLTTGGDAGVPEVKVDYDRVPPEFRFHPRARLVPDRPKDDEFPKVPMKLDLE